MPVPRFPLTKAPDLRGYSESRYKPVKKVQFQDNTEAIRPMSPICRRKFRCQWGSLTNAEKETVEGFFGSYGGYAFEFLPPFSDVPVLVRFDADELQFAIRTAGWNSRDGMRWSLSLGFVEMTDSPMMGNTAEEAAQ